MVHRQKLRIASMVTGTHTSPQPEGIIYAPIDLALALTRGLADRGHAVSYFAPEGSSLVAGKLETCGIPALYQSPETSAVMKTVVDVNRRGRLEQAWNQALIAHMFRRAEEGEYDILHIHPLTAGLPFGVSHPRIPVVYTLHDPIGPWRKMVYQQLLSKNQWLVAISNKQRKPAPHLPYAATIYNGVDVTMFPYSSHGGDHLLFIGRIHPDKGVCEAIKVAQITNERLIIAGQIGPEWQDFWTEKIQPHLNDRITYVGFVKRNELYKYYHQAKALLMPIQWDEPFGLVMAEAMACGTPVIAFNRGSVPEIVVDGQTGFIVETIEAMAAAVAKVTSISRQACRLHVEKNFSLEHMIDAYEHVYGEILEKQLRA